MLVSNLFKMRYGARKIPFNSQQSGNVPFISSKGTNFGIMGYVNLEPNAEYCLTIARVGTVGACFFHKEPCICNENVIIMEPLQLLTEQEMIYYALFLQHYATLFVYGRQITPTRLGELEIPSLEEIPEWVNEIEIPNFDYIKEAKNQEKVELPNFNKWKSFKLVDLFNLQKGQGGTQKVAKESVGTTPYVGASNENNGIVFYTGLIPLHSANTITVSDFGIAHYQNQPFVGSHIVVLEPNFTCNSAIGLFLCTLINASAYKYNFGRSFSISKIKETTISLPVNKQGEPDWQLMEDYINSLPYSATL